ALAGIGDHGHHRAVARLVRVHGDTGAQSEADHADPEVVRILHGVSPSWSGAGPESVPMRWTTRSRGGTTSRAAEEASTDSREQVCRRLIRLHNVGHRLPVLNRAQISRPHRTSAPNGAPRPHGKSWCTARRVDAPASHPPTAGTARAGAPSAKPRSQIGRAHVCTPVTFRSRMPSS